MENYLLEKETEIFQLLEQLVNIDSGTYVKGGTDRVGQVLKEVYEQEGFHVQVHDLGEYGGHLQIKATENARPRILIVGHMDTVFPDGTAKERPFHRDEKKAYGPGVSDMKACLVSVLYALKAIKEAGDPAYKNVEIIMNSDEEIGSPTSRELIEQSARQKDCAIIVEPARGEKDYIVTQRKSCSRYFIKVTGRGAHAGANPEDGISAIEEMAHKVIKLQALNDYDAGISVNVGLIEGGTSANSVPPACHVAIDVRTVTLAQAEEIGKKIKAIADHIHVPGTTAILTGSITHPPMIKDEGVEKLLHIVQAAGKEVGVNIEDTKTGGGSDGCFTAPIVPTIDGMGPAGGGAHSDREFLKISSFFERTVVLAQTIKKLNEAYTIS